MAGFHHIFPCRSSVLPFVPLKPHLWYFHRIYNIAIIKISVFVILGFFLFLLTNISCQSQRILFRLFLLLQSRLHGRCCQGNDGIFQCHKAPSFYCLQLIVTGFLVCFIFRCYYCKTKPSIYWVLALIYPLYFEHYSK